MKKTLFALALLSLTAVPLMLTAGNGLPVKECDKIIIVKNGDDIDESMKKLEVNLNGTMTDLENNLDQLDKNLSGKNGNIKITLMGNELGNDSPDAPFFGINPAELDFPKAQELKLTLNYGILITGIVPDSPAYQYRLVEDDVLLEVNGKKVLNTKELDKIKALYRAGDAVTLLIFRDGETKSIDFVFGSKANKPDVTIPGEKPAKKKISVGYGGGSWIPMMVTNDMTDVNNLIDQLGFSKLPENGILTQGGGGKGNVGKGWFLGGQLQLYTIDRKAGDPTDSTYANHMIYSMSMGGVTLDKRLAITKNVTFSLGTMLGWASHNVDITHTNGYYNWEAIGSTVYDSNNTKTMINRTYLLVQPRAELMVHFLPWLGMRAEAGYAYGYAPAKGWKVSSNDMDSYEIKKSPDTPFKGMTFSVGPWFGF